MNFLKKKLKPLTSGLSSVTSNLSSHPNSKHNKDDEDLDSDFYNDQVVDVPPHPSELLALGVDPTDIDVNNPDKLRELYRKAKEEGRDKKTNSVLLAKQRQKEDIEEKKKTAEEWKFFDSITARVEQVVKESQKTLEQLKESSAVETLAEPDYELRLTPDQVFRPVSPAKQERSANNWINFEEDRQVGDIIKIEPDPFGLVSQQASSGKQQKQIEQPQRTGNQNLLDDLLDDFSPVPKQSAQVTTNTVKKVELDKPEAASKTAGNIDDPFDTSFVQDPIEKANTFKEGLELSETIVDPFDTSFVNL